MQRVTVHRIPMAGPDDTSGLADLIERGTLDPADIICLLGKTEGNGCVNDWTRGFATTVFKAMLADRLRLPPEDIARRVRSCVGRDFWFLANQVLLLVDSGRRRE